MSSHSLLPAILVCTNVDPSTLDFIPLYLTSSSTQPIGLLLLHVVQQLFLSGNDLSPFNFQPSTALGVGRKAFFKPSLNTFEARSDGLKKLVENWREKNVFPDPLKGWRNEEYTIYGPSTECSSPTNHESNTGGSWGTNGAFKLERAACGLFGLTTFGVHLTGYTVGEDGQIEGIWVPRRSSTKQTWPGMLDQMVAGGLTHGLDPLSCVIKECAEEASIPASLISTTPSPSTMLLKSTGVVSYTTLAGEWVQPEVQFTYDLIMPAPSSFTPKPFDGESEDFRLLTPIEVLTELQGGGFKPNCSLVMIDFFIRHGLLTPMNEKNYAKITALLHQEVGFPLIES